jgi:nucleotide-binding universal stress UspA family protein
MRPKIVIAYDATPEADDGLALARVLADIRGADLLVARVLPDTPPEASDRAVQAASRALVQETREAAAEVLGSRSFEVWPVLGVPVAKGINALADERGAELIVFGSPQHGRVGRVLLGNAAAEACADAPCAVAVAPPGYRIRPWLSPPVIGVAYDGSAESAAALDAGEMLARETGVALRVMTVEPTGLHRPLHQRLPADIDYDRLRIALAGDLDVDAWLFHGDPVHILDRESERLGLLVCGSRALGPLHRAMAGSVLAALMRTAACPVLVVPRRVAFHTSSEPPLVASSHH